MTPPPRCLQCDAQSAPFAVDESHPALSWQLADERRGAKQIAWELQAATSADLLSRNEPDLWSASSDTSNGDDTRITYAGGWPETWKEVFWRVRSADVEGQWSAWSRPARFTVGLGEEAWPAAWLAATYPPEQADGPFPVVQFSTPIELSETPSRALLVCSARGLIEPWLDGARVTPDRFLPGWTEYAHRLEYVAYDVTDRLESGAHELSFLLAEGWFTGELTWGEESRQNYGKEPGGSAFLVTFDEAGAATVHAAEAEAWRVAPTAILTSDIYHGETIDLRADSPDRPTVETQARAVEPPEARLVAKNMPPVRMTERLSVVEWTEPQPGLFVADFGQNVVGTVQLQIDAPAGTVVTLRYAEMLEADGTLYLTNLRRARATDVVVASGQPALVEPRFTFHGFRYLSVSGLKTAPPAEALVLHSDMPRAGDFSCSHELINKLQSNIRWGQRGNFLDVPTDCPQRDERLGWTGDAQVFAETAAFNYDVESFFRRWMRDVALAQRPDGRVPCVVPAVLDFSPKALAANLPEATSPHPKGGTRHDAPGWSDAAVLIPWTLYRRYGDVAALAESYDLMVRWMRCQEKTAPNHIRPSGPFGDWLDPTVKSPERAPTPRPLIGTAFYAYTARLVSHAAQLLGRDDDAATFKQLSETVTEAFRKEFVTATGRLVGDTQTGWLLALSFDLLPESQRPGAVQHLLRLIDEANDHLATGFLGTPLLAPTLTRFGHTPLAYRILQQKTYPGWLFSVLNGATTIWERWDSWHPQMGFGDPNMNSFNHYAYGAIGQWLYATVAGLDTDPEQPGFKRARLHPEPGGDLTQAQASLATPHGLLTTSWTLADERFTFDVRIPPNTTADVALPTESMAGFELDAEPSSEPVLKDGRLRFELPAGAYSMSLPWTS